MWALVTWSQKSSAPTQGDGMSDWEVCEGRHQLIQVSLGAAGPELEHPLDRQRFHHHGDHLLYTTSCRCCRGGSSCQVRPEVT